MFRKFNKSYELKVERSPIHHPYEEKSGTFLTVSWVVGGGCGECLNHSCWGCGEAGDRLDSTQLSMSLNQTESKLIFCILYLGEKMFKFTHHTMV